MRHALAAVAALTLLAGCGSAAGTPAAVTVTATAQAATAQTSPAQTSAAAPAATSAAAVTTAVVVATLTIPQAAATYTAAVKPVNVAAFALTAELHRAPPRMDQVRALGAQCLAVDRAFLDVLTHTAWPTEVAPDIEAVARDVAAVVSRDSVIAGAQTPADVPANLPDTGSAQLVRAKLGLGVVPTA